MTTLQAGASVTDISPLDVQYLFGYPHVERFSTGIHDSLLSSALYLSDGSAQLIFITNDIIFVSKATTARVRQRIEEATGVPGSHILTSATHTHSGPSTIDYISLADDPLVPPVDARYLKRFEDGMVEAALGAYRRAEPAQVGLAVADATGVGTNRRDPSGPADPQAPVLMVRTADGKKSIACMVVYSMHPTVLREASKVVSGDFPAATRRLLQQHILGDDCPVLYHTGPAGNQSPRHVINANTLAEAQRLGEMLGRALAAVISQITYTATVKLQASQAFIDLPRRTFPPVQVAEAKLERAVQKLTHLRESGAAWQIVRGAEVDWFGAEEMARLSRTVQEGKLEAIYNSCLPAEIQALRIGPWSFVGWPGEIFVEHSLAAKAQCPNSYIISLANGDLQGYIATEEAAREGGYEASNAIFAPESGQCMAEATVRLLSA